jgi:hypothetical protein
MAKFEEVNAGNPNAAENALASLWMVREPHQSMIPIVWPVPSCPAA